MYFQGFSNPLHFIFQFQFSLNLDLEFLVSTFSSIFFHLNFLFGSLSVDTWTFFC